MSERKTPLSVLLHHLSSGIAFGAALGLLYFIIEPLLLHRSSHTYFGAPLSRVLFVYLSFGCVLGVIVGLLTGLLRGFMGRRSFISHPGPVVFPLLGLLFTSLFIVRNYYLSRFSTIPVLAKISLLVSLLAWAGVAFLLSRKMARKDKSPGAGTILSSACSIAAIVLLAVTGAWNYAAEFRLPDREPLSASSPNIILIVSDALRPDHLSVYGYARDTSPNLSLLADEGMMFSRAYAHGNRTYYTMPSLFTSLHHADHGFLWTTDMIYPLPESRITLAEMLRDAGYNTVGLMNNVMIKSELQMTQGFDRVEEFNSGRFGLSVYRVLQNLGILERPMTTLDAGRLTDKAIQWMGKMNKTPFFLYVHYMDTHHAYTPPAKYEEMFRSSTDRTEASALFQKTREFLLNPKAESLNGEELKRLIDLYDACIRYVDEEIGRIIDTVRSFQADRETFVIVTADHGDEFMEHGLVYHNNLLIEELIRVPLIMWSSQKRFERHEVNSLVRHIDVMPTIADWAGVEPPAEAAGASLVPLIEGAAEESDRELIAEGAESTCLIYQNWKILHVDSTDSYYLYDLSSDSVDRTDVSQDYPEKYALLKAKLREYMDRAEQADAEHRKPMSPEMIKQLKALGYM